MLGTSNTVEQRANSVLIYFAKLIVFFIPAPPPKSLLLKPDVRPPS